MMTSPIAHWRSFGARTLLRTHWGDVKGRSLLDLLLIVVGAVSMALSVDVFLDPNDVVPGGFTALAMFANRLWGWPVGATLLGMNIPVLILGIRLIGFEFGPKTVFASALVSLLIDVPKPMVPIVWGEPLLYVLYGGLLYGFGMGLVFRANATTGGSEIPAKLLERCFGIRMSTSLFAIDAVVLAIAAMFFGLAPALYALIAAWVMARVIDGVEAGFGAASTAYIVTGRPDEVKADILAHLERGVTVLRGEGGYTGTEKVMLFTVVARHQVSALRNLVSEADASAFMVVAPSHEVLGEGFRPLTRPRPAGRGKSVGGHGQ